MNAAGLKPVFYPGGALAPGGRFRIEGFRLQGGTRVRWDGVEIRTLMVSAERIEALVPLSARPGMHRIEVETGEGKALSPPVPVVDSAPGLEGAKRLGHRVVLKASGVGRGKPVVWVGDQVARNVKHRAMAEGWDEIEFEMPASAGCAVPVSVGESNFVLIPAQDGCPETASRLPVSKGTSRFALAAATRVWHWPLAAVEPMIVDEFLLAMREGGFSDHPVLSPPPVGSCVVYTGLAREGLLGQRTVPQLLRAALSGTPLELISKVQLSAAGRQIDLKFPGPQAGTLLARLGWRDPANPRSRPLFYEGSQVEIDFGRARIATPNGLRWTNREAFQAVDSRKAAEFRWQGGEVLLVLAASDPGAATSAIAVCAATGSSFVMPARIVSQLVPSSIAPGALSGFGAVLQIGVDGSGNPPAGLSRYWKVSAMAVSRGLTFH